MSILDLLDSQTQEYIYFSSTYEKILKTDSVP